MTNAEILFEVGRVCPDLTDEIFALLKRLDRNGSFHGPAKEANEQRFAKFCRDALQVGKFDSTLRSTLEKIESTLLSPGRPAMDPNNKRKNRSIKMTDTEWTKLQEKAQADGISVAEYIRRKTLAGD